MMLTHATYGRQSTQAALKDRTVYIDGKSSSPKTISSSSSPSSSGKRPFLRKKLFASKINASRIFNGKMFFSEFVLIAPVQRDADFSIVSPWNSDRTFSIHSSQESSLCLASGTYAAMAS